MIVLTQKFINSKTFYQMYKLLKNEEFIINMGSLGIRFTKKGAFMFCIEIVALGKDFGDMTYLTKEQLIKKETVIKEVAKKEKVTYHQEVEEVGKEDLF